MWSECRCLEKNSASYPLKKKIFGNLTIAFGTAWKCENIFVVLPHKLMLFTSICDSQSLIKLPKNEHRMASLSVSLWRAEYPLWSPSKLPKQTGEQTRTNEGLKFNYQTTLNPVFNNCLWKAVIWYKLMPCTAELVQILFSLDHLAMRVLDWHLACWFSICFSPNRVFSLSPYLKWHLKPQ